MGGVEPERPFDVWGIEHVQPYAPTGTNGARLTAPRRVLWDAR